MNVRAPSSWGNDSLLHEYVKLPGQGYLFLVFVGDLFSDLFFELYHKQQDWSGYNEISGSTWENLTSIAVV